MPSIRNSFFAQSALVSSNEFADFGKFAAIHQYFRDKYKKKRWGHHDDFYKRMTHFLKYLLSTINNESFDIHDSIVGNHYKTNIIALMVTPPTREEILAYFSKIAEKAQSLCETQSKEALFYQRFLVRMLLPALNIHSYVSDEEFNVIVDKIPGKMLFQEQVSILSGGRFDTPMMPNLFHQLRESVCPTIIARCIRVMSRFPEGPGKEPYATSILFLESIQNNRRKIPSNEMEKTMYAFISKTLSESNRVADKENLQQYNLSQRSSITTYGRQSAVHQRDASILGSISYGRQ